MHLYFVVLFGGGVVAKKRGGRTWGEPTLLAGPLPFSPSQWGSRSTEHRGAPTHSGPPVSTTAVISGREHAHACTSMCLHTHRSLTGAAKTEGSTFLNYTLAPISGIFVSQMVITDKRNKY